MKLYSDMQSSYIRQFAGIAALFIAIPALALRPEIKNYSKNLYDSGAQDWDIAQIETGVM